MKEALYYLKEEDNIVKCELCPTMCRIKPNHMGACRVRENIAGTLYAKTYAMVSSMALDPIEKKPLRMFKPGTKILSVGTYGCNFKCGFCQNYHISQQTPPLEHLPVNELLKISDERTDSIGIAFTYNEPTIWYEYVLETAKLNSKDTVLVTNGFINPEPFNELLPFVDAMNIDIKSIRPEFYSEVCGGTLDAVQQTIKTAHGSTHVELTFLAIPQVNDSEAEMEQMVFWIAGIDKKIPLHIIPFRPMYKWTHLPYQTNEKILRLKSIAKERLDYVF